MHLSYIALCQVLSSLSCHLDSSSYKIIALRTRSWPFPSILFQHNKLELIPFHEITTLKFKVPNPKWYPRLDYGIVAFWFLVAVPPLVKRQRWSLLASRWMKWGWANSSAPVFVKLSALSHTSGELQGAPHPSQSKEAVRRGVSVKLTADWVPRNSTHSLKLCALLSSCIKWDFKYNYWHSRLLKGLRLPAYSQIE